MYNETQHRKLIHRRLLSLKRFLHVAAAIRDELGLRAVVKAVPLETLPRYELKSNRFTDERPSRTTHPGS